MPPSRTGTSRPSLPRRGPGRPKGGGSDAPRRILDAAAQLFAENGFRATSLASVAAEAGLSQTALVHHFGSKDALLIAVLERRDAVDGQNILAGRVELNPGWAMFDDLIRLVEINRANPAMVRLFTALAAESVDPAHPAHEWMRRHHERFAQMICTALRSGIEQGSVRADVPAEQIARLVTAVMDGLQIQWLNDPAGSDLVGDFAAFAAGIRAQWATSPAS